VKSEDNDSESLYSVKISIKTREEAVHFHDKVMPTLSNTVASDEIYGAIFNAGKGKFINLCRDIEI
jgi:hypothetical protein